MISTLLHILHRLGQKAEKHLITKLLLLFHPLFHHSCDVFF